MAKKGDRDREPNTTHYLLRNIPNDAWRRAKAKAMIQGESIREVVIRLIKDYAEQPDQAPTRPPRRGR